MNIHHQTVFSTFADCIMQPCLLYTSFILLSQVGNAYVDRTVTEDEMRAGLEYIMQTKE